MKFDALGLAPELLEAIARLGFETPTPVQAQVIPRLLKNEGDVVALAQTGTGKTAAFGLPILSMLDRKKRSPQALVLCPTRELCVQITRDMESFATCYPDVGIVAVYGGTPIDAQLRALKKGVHVIVGTPGRMLDIMRRRKMDLSGIERVILDEADEMLNMGFEEDLESILRDVPDAAHTLLFSATMPRQVANIARKYMKDAYEITVGTRNAGAANVSHECYVVHQRDRYRALKRIADFYPNMYAIVFCRTRQDTQRVADWLVRDGYNVDALHGDLSQAQRDRVMEKFRAKSIQILVATDVAARGLDVNDLTHVINFSLPDDLNSYTHRSGRTGRAGKSGVSVVIVNMREKGAVNRLEKILRVKFDHCQVPSGREICGKQLLGLVDRVRDVEVDHKQIAPYLPDIHEQLEGMEKDELIKRFVSLEFNNLLEYYRKEDDLNPGEKITRPHKPEAGRKGKTPEWEDKPARRQRTERPERAERPTRARPERESGPAPAKHPRPASRSVRMFINIGQLDGVNTHKLGDMINTECGREVHIDRIDVMRRYSFFEVAPQDVEPLSMVLGKAQYGGRAVRVEPVDDEQKSKRIKRTERRIKTKRSTKAGATSRKPRKPGKPSRAMRTGKAADPRFAKRKPGKRG